MVKVRISYEDGRHYVALYAEGHAKANLAFVEMEKEMFDALQNHLARDRLWQNKLLELGNEQYEKDNPGWRTT